VTSARRRPGPSLVVAASLLVVAACSTAEAPQTGEPVAPSSAVAGRCPEPRRTARAPDSYYSRTNPLPGTAEHLDRGRRLYERDARPAPCASCHGIDGDGRGPAGGSLVPPPRNFACAETMRSLTDGQLYWVIEEGSGEFHVPATQGAQRIERPGRGAPFTAMRGHGDHLSDTEIWQLILYIRSMAR
jgi:mono/diheme cytochrome c family protein